MTMTSVARKGGKAEYLFAACATSVTAPKMYLRGRCEGTKFVSDEFTADLRDESFWDSLTRFSLARGGKTVYLIAVGRCYPHAGRWTKADER